MAKVIKKEAPRQPNALQKYFRETVGELRKVSWPSRQEATNLTGIVLVVILVLSTFLWILDVLYSRIFLLILGT